MSRSKFCLSSLFTLVIKQTDVARRAQDGEDVLTALAAQTPHPTCRSRTDDQRSAAVGNASYQRDSAELGVTDRPNMHAADVSRESLTSLQIEP